MSTFNYNQVATASHPHPYPASNFIVATAATNGYNPNTTHSSTSPTPAAHQFISPPPTATTDLASLKNRNLSSKDQFNLATTNATSVSNPVAALVAANNNSSSAIVAPAADLKSNLNANSYKHINSNQPKVLNNENSGSVANGSAYVNYNSGGDLDLSRLQNSNEGSSWRTSRLLESETTEATARLKEQSAVKDRIRSFNGLAAANCEANNNSKPPPFLIDTGSSSNNRHNTQIIVGRNNFKYTTAPAVGPYKLPSFNTSDFSNAVEATKNYSANAPSAAHLKHNSSYQNVKTDYSSTNQNLVSPPLSRSLSDNFQHLDYRADQIDANSTQVTADDEAFAMDSERLKGKFLSAWNNVKNGWTFGRRKASFSSPHPIWLLGVKYDSKGSSVDSLELNEEPSVVDVNASNMTSGIENRNVDSTENDGVVLFVQSASIQSPSDPEKETLTVNNDDGNGSPPTRRRSSSLGEEVTEQTTVLLNFPAFKHDFSSRIWFTYRKDFPPLPDTKSTSDTGWGCMLRSGQMMLAHSFLLHLLKREWRFQGRLDEQKTYLEILRWFDDGAALSAPFSLHSLVNIGRDSGKSVGDWYGPSSVAYVLRDALSLVKTIKSPVDDSALRYPKIQDVSIYVAQDCTVYKNDVIDQCFSNGNENSAVIILVPVRLGGDSFNPSYASLLQELFQSENCIGIIGGKPRHSLYFVGFQKEKLLYLDPHFCQPTVDMRADYFPTDSFRCSYPRKMHFSKMDPSCTLGFYCRNRNDFMQFCFQMTPTSLQRGVYPMFVISSSSYEAVTNTVTHLRTKKEKILRVHHLDSDGNPITQSEDFVFLEVGKSAISNNAVGKHSAATASS